MNHNSRKHALCGASSASRWLLCPGSVGLSKEAPYQPPSKYALCGTVAHELAERALREWLSNDCKIPDQWANVTDEMSRHVLGYLQVCQEEIANLHQPSVRIESPLVLRDELGMFGTVDVLATGRSLREETNAKMAGLIVDFKYGAGVPVV